MRERHEIEQELFEARQDLETDLAQLAHAVREKTEVRAKVMNAIEERPNLVWMAVGGAFLLGAILGNRRAEMVRALAQLSRS